MCRTSQKNGTTLSWDFKGNSPFPSPKTLRFQKRKNAALFVLSPQNLFCDVLAIFWHFLQQNLRLALCDLKTHRLFLRLRFFLETKGNTCTRDPLGRTNNLQPTSFGLASRSPSKLRGNPSTVSQGGHTLPTKRLFNENAPFISSF